MKLDISGQHFELNDKIVEYVQRKIGGLEKYLPKQHMDALRVNVVLAEDAEGREGKHFVCEVIISVPHAEPIQAKEATLNVYAAVDIVEAKLKAQIAKLKARRNPRWQQGRKWLGKVFGRTNQT